MNAPARRGFLPVNAQPMLRFVPAAGAREIALLGVVEVAEIGPCGDGRSYWRLWLPGCRQMGCAPSPKAAREHLASRIEQWVEAAGLAPAGRAA